MEVSTVNKVNEVAPEVSTGNKVNDESTVNEACRIACDIKEAAPEVSYSTIKEVELHIAHNVQEEQSGAEVQVEQNGAKVQVEQNGDKFDEVKSDVNVEAKVEVFGMKEVKNLKDEDKVEVFNAKVNNGKVGLHLFMKEVWSSGGATEKALLIVMFLLRFVNGFRRKCPIDLSDYG